MPTKRLYLDYETFRCNLTTGQNNYFAWIPGHEPSWLEGVVILSRPSAGAIVADASTGPLSADNSNVYYDELVPEDSQEEEYRFVVAAPFQHIRVNPTNANALVTFYSNGRLRKVDSVGKPL